MQLALDEDESETLAIIDTLPRPQQILALRARDYKRDNALLTQLATAMGKSSADIDAFFRRSREVMIGVLYVAAFVWGTWILSGGHEPSAPSRHAVATCKDTRLAGGNRRSCA